ncbi:hypothetical protein glysoja_010452 [Glycine soja]|nr:hypothetical protein glysoja_010452 [Glycine soja]
MCILVIALAFTLVIIPTLQFFTTQIFKPNSVEKSWDSLNFVLILFVILCGFLSRNNTSDTPHEYDKSTPPTLRPWYEESDRTPPYKSFNRLRSFNSHPDLRQDSPWMAADERWRFYDDTHVNGYRGFDLEEESVMNIEGKKKKRRQLGSVESFKSIPSQASSVFHNMFSSKKSKRKKLNTASSSHVSLSKTEPMPAWKFRVQGDFVRIDSISSSSSDSPDLEDEIVDSPSNEDGGEPESEILLFYPIQSRFKGGEARDWYVQSTFFTKTRSWTK